MVHNMESNSYFFLTRTQHRENNTDFVHFWSESTNFLSSRDIRVRKSLWWSCRSTKMLVKNELKNDLYSSQEI